MDIAQAAKFIRDNANLPIVAEFQEGIGGLVVLGEMPTSVVVSLCGVEHLPNTSDETVKQILRRRLEVAETVYRARLAA